MPTWDALLGLGLAVGLGLIVGLQREREAPAIAGIRTFALISLTGALAAMLSASAGPWIVVAALIGVVAMAVVGTLACRPEGAHPGITTEIAIVLMFAVGALCVYGPREVAALAGGVSYVLLHFKVPLHRFVASLGTRDLTAIAQLVLVSLVILPLLPDRAIGPYEVLNPRHIWWMVLLVMSLSLAAYVALKLVGERVGVVVAGVLGGLISSTATTVAQSRLVRNSHGAAAASAVIMVASTVLYARILVLIGATGPGFLAAAAAPVAALGLVSAGLSFVAWRGIDGARPAPIEPSNPAQLWSAVTFGAIFAVVLVLVAAAQERYGAAGLYASAALGGLTDLDAITLSTTRLVTSGSLDAESGWRAIVVATIANTATKTVIVAVLGGPRLLRRVVSLQAALIAASALTLAVWG